ncbi:MAG: hypothetical protein JNG84_11410 [Archangium sp.]|nr:hypothetical protein [Archangium sp.]
MRWLVAICFAGCGAAPTFTTSQSCGTCHAPQRAEWETSAHARSDRTPAFIALLPRVDAEWGASARARCEGCHAPGHGDTHAIGCASCHLATGNRGTANGALEVRLDAPVSTVRSVNAPHATTQRGFLQASELCGTCHDVRGPGLLDEPTFTEFQATNPPVGTTCISCHVSSGHGFEVSDGLTLERTELAVQVRNDGARHRIPTGMAAMRDIWVDVTIEDEAGRRTEAARVIELGAELDAPLFIDATFIRPRGLQFGESRSWSPPDGSRIVDARLQRRRIRDAARQVLGLE